MIKLIKVNAYNTENRRETAKILRQLYFSMATQSWRMIATSGTKISKIRVPMCPELTAAMVTGEIA